jgi:hypothetical protein
MSVIEPFGPRNGRFAQVRLLTGRNLDAKHVVFQTRDLSAALVALMNLIFAYGEMSLLVGCLNHGHWHPWSD